MPEHEVWQHVDKCEQEQPDDVDKMPIPSCKLEAEMLFRGHVLRIEPEQTHCQEDCPDNNVRAVEAGRHKEGGSIGRAVKSELRQ